MALKQLLGVIEMIIRLEQLKHIVSKVGRHKKKLIILFVMASLSLMTFYGYNYYISNNESHMLQKDCDNISVVINEYNRLDKLIDDYDRDYLTHQVGLDEEINQYKEVYKSIDKISNYIDDSLVQLKEHKEKYNESNKKFIKASITYLENQKVVLSRSKPIFKRLSEYKAEDFGNYMGGNITNVQMQKMNDFIGDKNLIKNFKVNAFVHTDFDELSNIYRHDDYLKDYIDLNRFIYN